MARSKAAKKAPEAETVTPPEATKTPAGAEPAETRQAPAEPSTGKAEANATQQPVSPEAAVDPFPSVIKTAVLADGYRIRLLQRRYDDPKKEPEVQIKFGDGTTRDKPPQAVIDFIKAQEGPNRTRFGWNDEDRAWGMPIRDPIRDPQLLATREKGRQVFNEVVKMVAQHRGTGQVR